MNRTRPAALDAAIFVAAALGMNGLIFALGWDGSSGPRPDIAPAGAVIGAVWVVLLAALGLAHGWLRQRGERGATARWMAVALLVLCLAYPVYTQGLSNPIAGLAGNLVVAVFAAAFIVFAAPIDRRAAIAVVPMIAWITYASAITGAALA